MPMPETYRIPIQTVTPLWTGDVEMKTSYIKGSSIVGNLRFWTDALMRSLGHRVCKVTDGEDIYRPFYP